MENPWRFPKEELVKIKTFCIEFDVPIALSHWNITLQAQLYHIPSCHINLATGQPVFALNYPLCVEHLTRELQLPIWNLWFDSAGQGSNPGPFRHRGNVLPLGYQCWFNIYIYRNPQRFKWKIIICFLIFYIHHYNWDLFLVDQPSRYDGSFLKWPPASISRKGCISITSDCSIFFCSKSFLGFIFIMIWLHWFYIYA